MLGQAVTEETTMCGKKPSALRCGVLRSSMLFGFLVRWGAFLFAVGAGKLFVRCRCRGVCCFAVGAKGEQGVVLFLLSLFVRGGHMDSNGKTKTTDTHTHTRTPVRHAEVSCSSQVNCCITSSCKHHLISQLSIKSSGPKNLNL